MLRHLGCAGMVSLLPTIDSRLFHIKGGNRLLAERLINATGANLLLGRRVTAVHKGAQGGFQVHSRRADAPKEVRTDFHGTHSCWSQTMICGKMWCQAWDWQAGPAGMCCLGAQQTGGLLCFPGVAVGVLPRLSQSTKSDGSRRKSSLCRIASGSATLF